MLMLITGHWVNLYVWVDLRIHIHRDRWRRHFCAVCTPPHNSLETRRNEAQLAEAAGIW